MTTTVHKAVSGNNNAEFNISINELIRAGWVKSEPTVFTPDGKLHTSLSANVDLIFLPIPEQDLQSVTAKAEEVFQQEYKELAVFGFSKGEKVTAIPSGTLLTHVNIEGTHGRFILRDMAFDIAKCIKVSHDEPVLTVFRRAPNQPKRADLGSGYQI